MPRYHPCVMNVGRRPEKRKEAPGEKENAEPNKKRCLSLRKGKDKGEPQQRFCEISNWPSYLKVMFLIILRKILSRPLEYFGNGDSFVKIGEVGFLTYSKGRMIVRLSPIV